MIKITGTLLAAAAMLWVAPIFAGEKKGEAACCAKGASHDKMACADFASLGVTAEQKTKLEAWSAECMKGGCTKESRAKFLKQAKSILTAEQFAKVKAQCKGESKDKSET
jgi:hypothetical protein